MKKQKFSLFDRAKSFRYAFEGVIDFFKAEHNAVIHLFSTIIVVMLSFICSVSRMEAVALAGAIGFVWVCELFNTAIERMMDHITPERNLSVKFIKDVSAAAVLFASVTSFIIGAIVFIPKLLML
jgi:diacylglycerol kinase